MVKFKYVYELIYLLTTFCTFILVYVIMRNIYFYIYFSYIYAVNSMYDYFTLAWLPLSAIFIFYPYHYFQRIFFAVNNTIVEINDECYRFEEIVLSKQ